jgi:glycolate oxidase iron-sulfur subunit
MEQKELLGKDTAENVYHCIKCGLCSAHCPVYKEIRMEHASPRGKVQLTKKMLENDLGLTEEIKSAFFSTCLLCGSCVANCPSGVDQMSLFSGVRWRSVQKYGADWRKRAMFRLLSSRWMMSASATIGEWARRNFGGQWIESKIHLGALSADRVPPLNEKPFTEMVPEVVEPKGGKVNAKVLYFHGCATKYLYGDIGMAVVDVLSKMGVEVIIPRDQGCCGLPIFFSGERRASIEVIREALRLFARDDVDACGSSLKNEYYHMLKDLKDLGENVTDEEIKSAELLSAKLQDVSLFIDLHKKWLPEMNPTGEKIRVTYHDPCHLAKGQKVTAQPRNILKSVPNIEFVEMNGAIDCCGGGGSFQIDYPEISAMITKRKVDHIEATKAQFCVTGCPGCNLTISNHLDPAIKVLHPVQLLQKALNSSQ